MTEGERMSAELVSLVRSILEDFATRFAVLHPDAQEAMEKAITQACAALETKCWMERQKISSYPPEDLAGAAEFLRNMRINFLGAANESYHVV